ncbi:DUF445 domain-containing protein [Diaphorobacter aerolatus]|nr:DUF445 domain-containing protein [Diaphorobacter aerolatus]
MQMLPLEDLDSPGVSAATAARAAHLSRAKAQATGLFVAVVVVFALTYAFPQNLWVECIRAMSEAAMVGALADWFAVSALFKRIPLPYLSRHTNIIARNKDRIGDNLSAFVRDRFLDAPSLVTMIRRHDPADMLAQWLTSPANAGLLGKQVSRLLATALDTVEDDKIQELLNRAAKALIGQLDISRTMAAALGAFTHERRHQVLLDDLLVRLNTLLQTPDTRSFIAQTLVNWIKREHPLKQKVLPTDWLSGKGASAISHAVETLLVEVAKDPNHQLRDALDLGIKRLIERMQEDPDWEQRGEQIRIYLQNDEALGSYVHEIWADLRGRLRSDLQDEDSAIARNVSQMGKWLGMSLVGDAALRHRLNVRLELWAAQWAPDVAQSVAEHIRATVERWDALEMAELIEQHIGSDLQYIRINGTIVGGLIGLVLFVISHATIIWAMLTRQ